MPEFTPPDPRPIATTLAEQVSVFRATFALAYNDAWTPEDEGQRMAEALAVEYGKHLLAALANPPIMITPPAPRGEPGFALLSRPV